MISVSFLLLPAIAAAYFSGFIREYLTMFFVLVLHEFAHLIAVRKRTVGITRIKIEPFGISIRLAEEIIKDPKDEMAIAAAGPLFSIATGAAAYALGTKGGDIRYFGISSLALGLFNLIPAYPTDGGRILRAYLTDKLGYIKSYNTSRKLTAVISVFLIASGIYVFYMTKFNFTICLTGCFLVYGLLSEKNHRAYYLNRELAEYKTKNAVIEKMPVIHIAVNKNFKARKILLEMSFNRYCIAEVIDGYKKIGELTEGELLKAVTENGSDVRVKDIIHGKRVN